MSKRSLALLLILGVATLVGGLLLPNWMSYLFTIAMGKGLVVLGLVLLMRAGLVSFGQGLYYCLGAYVAGMLTQFAEVTDVLLILLASVSFSVVIAAIIGLLLCRYREIFFAMFSMAFSMILYGLLVRNQVLGSTDGFNVANPSLLGWAPGPEGASNLVLAVAVLLVFTLGILAWRYLKSLSGYAGEAVRENEIRLEYLGGSVFKIIYVKYIIAAGLAAIGGTVTALVSGHVDPEMAYWTTSGEFVFIALMGGTGHVAAPIIAAVLFEAMRTYASAVAPYTWQMILGFALLAIILFLPSGLWSLVERFQNKKPRKTP
ncbi:branched-chain amino acid ABC transporter permease [Marinobacter sp. BSs20148]|jgi:ABC-type branched-subunit amino acid transport system permease subunit|uniref:branched-chain amino acid ABC transporter permease n=1 Tax=Marinobacter TaxID=2742 RepID=UPI0002776C46|nr:branched-chain amino acid ABC transporter permease [Marinobacter sp. BSs20148]AFP29324.1 High-affinity branched-chain amino acid transport system permease protein livM [Marinobacter sp. BSs20148]